MLRFAVLAIWFAAVCAAPTTEEIDSPDVMVVDSIDEYLVQHPNVEILKQLKEDEMEDRLHVGYTIGERVSGKERFHGDARRLIYFPSNFQEIVGSKLKRSKMNGRAHKT